MRVSCRHYVNQTAHPEFDPLQRRTSVLSAAFYDQMVVLVRVTEFRFRVTNIDWRCRDDDAFCAMQITCVIAKCRRRGAHPVAHEIRAGSFLMPIGAKLQDGKVNIRSCHTLAGVINNLPP